MLVHDNASVEFQPGAPQPTEIGTDADSDHHDIGIDDRAIDQFYRAVLDPVDEDA
jgi:hypothetical protein